MMKIGKIKENELTIKGNQFVWIPCDVESYKKITFGSDGENVTNVKNWERNTNSAELQQIMKYGGFYIGRFEAGTSKIKLSNNVTFGCSEVYNDWQSENYTWEKVTDGMITERPRRDTMVSCELSNCN